MDYFADENNIIEYFQKIDAKSVAFPVFNRELRLVFSSIHKKKNWKRWVNSSGKNDPPPDFYNKELKFMMDVMRVDDHEYVSSKGKVVNEQRKLESQAISKFVKSEDYRRLNNPVIFADIFTDLPTDEDHNFTRYKECFRRTIENHKNKIPNYEKNHPGYKVIFFVFDESSAYFETKEKFTGVKKKDMIFEGNPHIQFLDKEFLKVIIDSDIDYLIWFTPYKLCRLSEGGCMNLPLVAIYSRENMDLNYINYDPERIISVEE